MNQTQRIIFLFFNEFIGLELFCFKKTKRQKEKDKEEYLNK